MDSYDTSESSQERTFGSFDWLFGESQSPKVRGGELLETYPETSEDSPKAGQSFEVSATYDPIWTTARRDKIPLSKMETRHICNCIRLLESKHMYKHKWYRIFQNELERRKTGKLEASYSLLSIKALLTRVIDCNDESSNTFFM